MWLGSAECRCLSCIQAKHLWLDTTRPSVTLRRVNSQEHSQARGPGGTSGPVGRCAGRLRHCQARTWSDVIQKKGAAAPFVSPRISGETVPRHGDATFTDRLPRRLGRTAGWPSNLRPEGLDMKSTRLQRYVPHWSSSDGASPWASSTVVSGDTGACVATPIRRRTVCPVLDATCDKLRARFGSLWPGGKAALFAWPR